MVWFGFECTTTNCIQTPKLNELSGHDNSLSLTQSWKQCALPVIPVINRKSCTQVHQLPQSYCGDNGEGALFSWLYVYIIISHHQMRQTRFHHLRGILKVMSFLSSLTDKLWFFFAGINFGEFNIEKYFAGI